MKPKNYTPRLKYIFCKILAFFVAFLLLALPTYASNQPGPYFTLTGSIDSFEDMALTNISTTMSGVRPDMGRETGLGFNHSIGYKFRNSFSTELEFSYKGADFKPGSENSEGIDGDMSTKSFLVNGLYSFNIREFYTPYIGYGVGVASHEANVKGLPEKGRGTLAYQFKMGVDVEYSRKLSLLLGYRYFATDNPAFIGLFTAESASHSIEAGVKIHFSN